MNEVLRQEKKYLINIMDVGRMSGFLEKVMSKDEHNGYEGYAVRSQLHGHRPGAERKERLNL